MLSRSVLSWLQNTRHAGRAGKLELKLDKVRLADGEEAAITAGDGKAGGHGRIMGAAMVAGGLLYFPVAPLSFIDSKGRTVPKARSSQPISTAICY